MRKLIINRTSLLKKCFFLICLLILPLNIAAQHCPFDGTGAIVVHLTDAKNNPVTDAVQNLVLRETDNPDAEACTYAEGLLEKPFFLANDAFSSHYSNQNSPELIRRYCADCAFLIDGFYAVKLSQTETSCMIKKDGDFDYKKRKFEISFERNGVKITKEVPADKIYSLCTGAGKWSRIVPIEIKFSE